MRIKLAFAVICLFLLAAGLASNARANQSVSINLSDLMKAQVAFTGVCTAAEAGIIERSGKPGGILVTSYTFDVSESLKGDVPKTFTFTQWGASREDAARLGMPFVYGPPLYRIGKEYTLFLTSESTKALRAPVGLGQGKFTVVREPDGKAMVVNETGNRSLFNNLPQTKAMTKALSAGGIKAGVQAPAGPVDYTNFRDMVKSLSEKE